MPHQKINYLKVCVNKKCNFHCVFCQLLFREDPLSDKEVLTTAEMAKLVDGFSRSGVEYMRIIGGEPLLKEDILDFIYMISSAKRLRKISLTTNGFYLKDKALALKGAGLDRVNISLCSLDETKFRKITGANGLGQVIEGICAAGEAGLTPIRINVVLLKGLNSNEIEDFTALSILYPLDVRFIEYFPDFKNSSSFRDSYIPGYVVKNSIEFAFGPLIADKSNPNEGPATYYRIKDAKGRIGFINAVTEFFCINCNTLILHNDGKLFPCLHSLTYFDLMQPLRNNEFRLLSDKIHNCVNIKPQINKDTKIENFSSSS